MYQRDINAWDDPVGEESLRIGNYLHLGTKNQKRNKATKKDEFATHTNENKAKEITTML